MVEYPTRDLYVNNYSFLQNKCLIAMKENTLNSIFYLSQ